VRGTTHFLVIPECIYTTKLKSTILGLAGIYFLIGISIAIVVVIAIIIIITTTTTTRFVAHGVLSCGCGASFLLCGSAGNSLFMSYAIV
jgi:hypothetical protein